MAGKLGSIFQSALNHHSEQDVDFPNLLNLYRKATEGNEPTEEEIFTAFREAYDGIEIDRAKIEHIAKDETLRQHDYSIFNKFVSKYEGSKPSEVLNSAIRNIASEATGDDSTSWYNDVVNKLKSVKECIHYVNTIGAMKNKNSTIDRKHYGNLVGDKVEIDEIPLQPAKEPQSISI